MASAPSRDGIRQVPRDKAASGLGVKCDPGVGAPGPGVMLPRLLSRSQVHRAGGWEDRAVPRPEPPADVQRPLHCDPGQHEEGKLEAKPGLAAQRPLSSPAPLHPWFFLVPGLVRAPRCPPSTIARLQGWVVRC